MTNDNKQLVGLAGQRTGVRPGGRRQLDVERALREGRERAEPLLRRYRTIHRPSAARGRRSPGARTA